MTEFDAHHRRPLRQELGAPYTAGLGAIAFRVPDGRAYTYVPGDVVEVRPGVEGAATIIDLPLDEWEAFAEERWTRYGLLFHGHATFASGSFEDLCRWEPALRALVDGRPVWDASRLDLPDDTARTFTLDDSHAERADFLQRAGYLQVRHVFDAEEVAALREEVEALAATSSRRAATSSASNTWRTCR